VERLPSGKKQTYPLECTISQQDKEPFPGFWQHFKYSYLLTNESQLEIVSDRLGAASISTKVAILKTQRGKKNFTIRKNIFRTYATGTKCAY
jgi:hypothetical protein